MYDADLSAEIYRTLMGGKVINRHKLNNSGEAITDPLFEEILSNLKSYRMQYEMCGWELVIEANYVFVRDRVTNNENLKTDITMRASLLLLMLGKYLNEHNYRVTKLTEYSGGISRADIEIIQEMPDVRELIEKAQLKNDLFTEFKNVLVNRNIMLEKPSSETFILSDAGKAFFEEIFINFIID